MPGPQVCVGGCLRVVARGMAVGARFPGRRGRRPLRVAREWAAAGACPSSGPAGPPSPKGEGKGCSGGIHPSRGVGASLRGASGTPPPTACPGMGGSGSLPLIRPCGATFPQGGRQGLLLAAAGGRGGVEAPRPTDGDMETLWGLRGHPFPGRRTVGAGHARPGGWREHPFPFYRLTPPTSPPAYSRCCRRQNRWGRSAHRPHARFRRWIRSRGASGHRRSGPEGTGVCRRCNFSSAG